MQNALSPPPPFSPILSSLVTEDARRRVTGCTYEGDMKILSLPLLLITFLFSTPRELQRIRELMISSSKSIGFSFPPSFFPFCPRRQATVHTMERK